MTAPASPVPVWRLPRALAVGLVVAGDLVVLSLEPRSLPRALVSQSIWILLTLLGCVASSVRAHREPEAKVGWSLLAFTYAMMCVAISSTVVEYVRAGAVLPFPRPGDWLQLLAFAVMGFALLAWPLGSRSQSVRLRTFVDALLFAIATFAILWGLVLFEVRAADVPGDVWGMLVGQFGTMAVLLSIIAYVGAGDFRHFRGPLGWITAAVTVALLASVAALAAGATGAFYIGHWSELVGALSMVLAVQATASPRTVAGAAPPRDVAIDPLLLGGWLTYGSVGTAFAVAFYQVMVLQRQDKVLVSLGFAILALLLMRQLLAVRDIRRLTEGLEAKVAERTRALEESQAALLRTQRLEALGRLAGGVAHDFNNLLTGILGYAELIESATSDDDPRRDDAQEIRKSVERGARLTRQLLAFARKQPGHEVVLDPLGLVMDLETLMRRLIGPHITLEVGGQRRISGEQSPAPAADQLVSFARPAVGRVRIDPGQLEQVLVNMVINARDAMNAGGTLSIEVKDVWLSEFTAERIDGARAGEFVRLSVTDTGIGMSPEVLARIFEPFFTTKEESKGTGLGLATCYGIIRQASGFITAESQPGRGTRFDVYLPRTEDEEEWRPSSGGVEGPARGSETILLAEDEASVREVMAATLQSQGYTVLVAKDGEAAVAAASAHQGPIDLLLTDMMMPGMNGLAAAAQISKMRPGLRVLVVSGYMPDGVAHAPEGLAVSHVAKPVSPLELVRRVRTLLDERQSAAAHRPR